MLPTNNNLINVEIILNSNKEYEFTKYKQLKAEKTTFLLKEYENINTMSSVSLILVCIGIYIVNDKLNPPAMLGRIE